MDFDFDLAVKLWTKVHALGYDGWDCREQVVRIAAMCGLGVLTIEAKQNAVESVRKDYSRSGPPNRAMYQQLNLAICGPKWAGHLLTAATTYPPRKSDYPILQPAGHIVGVPPCFGQARKGAWSDACYRAAWGNVEPYGLELAEKPCPRCGKTMKYWCWGRQGDERDACCRWSIDHEVSHVDGGCVCHFNLQALHPGCNSAKGTG